jgi:Flp pilus assembly protein TadG
MQAVQGQALVETALTIPFLMLILVGGMEVGRISYAAIEVSNAASAAALYASEGGGAAVDLSGMTTAAQSDAKNLTGLTITPSYALVCSDGTIPSDSTTGPPWSNTDCSGSTKQAVVTITTKVSFDTLLHFPGIPSTINLYGRATQKVLGN